MKCKHCDEAVEWVHGKAFTGWLHSVGSNAVTHFAEPSGMPKGAMKDFDLDGDDLVASRWDIPTDSDAFLMMAKLRYLLYDAIVELQYVQDAEDHSQCASGKGRQIIERGMELLEVKDLSREHL